VQRETAATAAPEPVRTGRPSRAFAWLVVTLGWLVAGVCAAIAVILLPVTHMLGRKYLRRVQARFRRRAEAA